MIMEKKKFSIWKENTEETIKLTANSYISIDRVIVESIPVDDWAGYIMKNNLGFKVFVTQANGFEYSTPYYLTTFMSVFNTKPFFEINNLYFPNEDLQSMSLENLSFDGVRIKLLSNEVLDDELKLTIYYSILSDSY